MSVTTVPDVRSHGLRTRADQEYVLVSIKLKSRTAGRMSMMTIALNFFMDHPPLNKGFWAGILWDEGSM